jgi:L-threonylcarbamoyladenylate synthase
MNDPIQVAAQTLLRGELIIFPTETVYGLGADAANPAAVAKIYSAKNRPSENPLIVHIANAHQLSVVAISVNTVEQQLIDTFWPGPLTIVLPRNPAFPDAVAAGYDTIAVRFPADPLIQDVILAANTPIAAPSANRSGRPSPTRTEHLDPDIMKQAGYVLTGQPCRYGVESTVVRVLNDAIHILRPGAISRSQIEAAVTAPVCCADPSPTPEQPILSPGTQFKHYAPDTPLRLMDSADIPAALRGLLTNQQRVAVLVSQETRLRLARHIPEIPGVHTIVLGSENNLTTVAADLFHHLHALDQLDVDIALIQTFSRDGIGESIMDRLMRAAQ